MKVTVEVPEGHNVKIVKEENQTEKAQDSIVIRIKWNSQTQLNYNDIDNMNNTINDFVFMIISFKFLLTNTWRFLSLMHAYQI